jgi:serine/threonine protein phosphatase PrpC
VVGGEKVMVKDTSSSQWLCTGKSVRGSAHDRSGLPNQDAIAWYPESQTGAPLILAIADGHGSAKSFRSDRGSQFAVKTAIEVIQEFLLAIPREDTHFSIVKNMENMVKRLLPRKLTDRWKDSVRQHFQEYRFTDAEKKTLLDKEGEKGLNSIQDNPFLAYGATLLVVVITESFILYLQLGDGDILSIDEGGKTTRPLVKNPDLIGNETTSLCMDNAWNQFQIKLEPQNTHTQIPALILLSTDGYSNSYASDEEFFKIGQDYLQEIHKNGIEAIDRQLESFLKEISTGGSGDDITLGIISRIERPDRQQGNAERELEQTIEIGDGRVEVNNSRRPKKIQRINKSLDQKVITITSLVLAISSTCLSSYLFFKLLKTEQELTAFEKIHLSSQKTVTTLAEKIDRLEAKQNASTAEQRSTVTKKRRGGT